MRKIVPAALAAASLAAATSAGAAEAPARFDLAAGAVNGKVLLGRSPQQLLTTLGKPALLDGLSTSSLSENAVRTILNTPSENHHVVVWGKGKVWHVAAQVGIRNTNGVPVVWSLIFADPADREARLGTVLTRKPQAIGQALRNRYKDVFRPTKPYACGTKPGSCYGVFSSKDGKRKITFGLFAGSNIRFVNVWLTGN
jgi:hypothetical protein